MGATNAWLLSAAIFAPVLMALFVFGLRVLIDAEDRAAGLWRVLGLATSTAVFGFAVALFVAFDPTDTGFQFVTWLPWLPAWGAHYFAGLDGISLLLVLLTAFLFPVVFLACWETYSRDGRYVLAMLVLETGLLGSFAALNLFQLQVFNWLAVLPAASLLAGFGTAERIPAAVRFLAFSFGASVLMLLGTLALGALHAEQFGGLTARSLDLVGAPGGFVPSLLDAATGGPDAPFWQQSTWIFAAFALGFAIQGPMVPIHAWLPAAQSAAPTGLDALLGGLLAKLGLYGFLRVALPLFPDAAAQASGVIAVLSMAGVLYAAAVALRHVELKRIVAALSVAQLAIPLLGFASLSLEGIEGGVLHLLSHGLAFTALFLLIGMLAERREAPRLDEFGGIARPMPVFAGLFMLAMFAALGLPPMGGFVGELLVLLAAFDVSPVSAALATLGVAVAAIAGVWLARRLLFGPVENPANRGLIDLGRRERAVILALLIPLLWIGLHPVSFLSRLEPTMGELRRRMEQRSARPLVDEQGSRFAIPTSAEFARGGQR